MNPPKNTRTSCETKTKDMPRWLWFSCCQLFFFCEMWMYVKSKVRYRACSGTSPFTLWKSLERSAVRPLQNASNCTLDHFQDHFEKFHFQYAMVLPPQFCYHEIPQSISSNFDIQIYYYDIPKYLNPSQLLFTSFQGNGFIFPPFCSQMSPFLQEAAAPPAPPATSKMSAMRERLRLGLPETSGVRVD